jgi:predicted nuclease of predicted toxin-antitoxin system
MRLLLNQDVYANTARLLRKAGHDVLLAAQVGLSQAEDEELLEAAQKQGRIFVTRDRDFGNLVFVKALGMGVIYLRMLPSTQNAVNRELGEVLQKYSEGELSRLFIVIEATGHRTRKIGK